MKHYCLIILFLLLLISCSEKETIIVYEKTGMSMGTDLEIKVFGLEEAEANKAMAKAMEEVERINQKYSTYINNSYLNELNKKKDTIELDAETFYLFSKSDMIYNLTEGAFDPAVGNIIDLIGFEKGTPNLPSQDTLLKVLENVGWKHVKIVDINKIYKKDSIKINLNAIAKGYAVDKAAEVLEKNGVKGYLVNLGGEVKGIGMPWKVGISHPRRKGALLGTLLVDSIGVATSGDYQQYFKKDKIRYSHIINPVTGLPAGETQSVSVITKSLTDADGLATGIFVMGSKKGMELIESLDGTEAIIVDSTGKVSYSSGIEKYFRRQ